MLNSNVPTLPPTLPPTLRMQLIDTNVIGEVRNEEKLNPRRPDIFQESG